MKKVDFDYLKDNLNTLLASSPWFQVEQSLINNFAEITGDKQWIHIDPVRAKTESPYKSTIAHGFLLLSLIPQLAQQSYSVEGVNKKINYGLNKVRFLHAVKPSQRVKAHFFVEQCQKVENGYYKTELRIELEIEGLNKLAFVAQSVVLYLP